MTLTFECNDFRLKSGNEIFHLAVVFLKSCNFSFQGFANLFLNLRFFIQIISFSLNFLNLWLMKFSTSIILQVHFWSFISFHIIHFFLHISYLPHKLFYKFIIWILKLQVCQQFSKSKNFIPKQGVCISYSWRLFPSANDWRSLNWSSHSFNAVTCVRSTSRSSQTFIFFFQLVGSKFFQLSP